MQTVYWPSYTRRPVERGIQETSGNCSGFVMPGLGLQIRFIQVVRSRDIRQYSMDIDPQPVITKDKVGITVDGILWVRPTADEETIKRTFRNIDEWKRAIAQLATTNLRQEFGDLTLDESLVARETIANSLQGILNTFAVGWGLTVSQVEIRLRDAPGDIKRAMHKQKTAEQERRSMRLLATGEFEAAEQQKPAIIQRAQAEREAAIQVAQRKAEAIRRVKEAAERYFLGNAQTRKQMEMIDTSSRDSAKIVITEHGIRPTLLLGSLPVSLASIEKNGQAASARI